MKNQISTTRSLIKNLASFGLNPMDWQIGEISLMKKTLIFKNKSDQNFQLIGSFEKEQKQISIRGLELFSI